MIAWKRTADINQEVTRIEISNSNGTRPPSNTSLRPQCLRLLRPRHSHGWHELPGHAVRPQDASVAFLAHTLRPSRLRSSSGERPGAICTWTRVRPQSWIGASDWCGRTWECSPHVRGNSLTIKSSGMGGNGFRFPPICLKKNEILASAHWSRNLRA